jgi:prevent-host-death family protein
MIVIMRTMSLAEAKAHLSALVDEAEHHHKRILILRHGKPAAAIVPVEVAVPARRRLSTAEIDEVFAGLGNVAPQASAVDDLLSGRR